MGEAVELPEGTLTVNADGTYTFVPTADFNGTLVVGYVVTDSEGSSDAAVLTITVTPESDAPRVVDPVTGLVVDDPDGVLPDVVSPEGQALQPIPTAQVFAEPDGQPLVFTLEGAPDWLTIDPDTGVVTGTPPADAGLDGPVAFSVVATDPDGLSVRAGQVLDLRNTVPEALPDGVVTTEEDVPVTIDVLANDTDADGDTLSVVAVDGRTVSQGVPILVTGGSVVLNADGTLTFTPAPDFNGTASFSYTASDGEGETDDATFDLLVTAVNDGPAIVPGPDGGPAVGLPGQSSLDGESITALDVTSVFSDVDGDPLAFTVEGLPPGLAFDPETGLVSGTLPPGASRNGPYTVTITATDPDGQSVSTTFTWGVANTAPRPWPSRRPSAWKAVNL